MKVRDSGMPDEEMWSGFFHPAKVLAIFGLDRGVQDLVEFGCGYGTFTLAAARITAGTVHALDIEPEMVSFVQQKCREAAITKVRATVRDFVTEGTGLADNSMDAALLFNILHHEEPVSMMKEALRVLNPNGVLAVIHWNYDPLTPRGPAMEIRPQPNSASNGGEKPGSVSTSGTAPICPRTTTGCSSGNPLPDEALAACESAENSHDQQITFR